MSDKVLPRKGFKGNKLLMHKYVHYRVSWPNRILLALSFRVLNYIQKSYKLFCFMGDRVAQLHPSGEQVPALAC